MQGYTTININDLDHDHIAEAFGDAVYEWLPETLRGCGLLTRADLAAYIDGSEQSTLTSEGLSRFAHTSRERAALTVIEAARELSQFHKERGGYESDYLGLLVEAAEDAGMTWFEIASAVFVDHPSLSADVECTDDLFDRITS